MDTQRWERAGNIFEKLLDAPDEQRTALLETLCGDDAEMRDIVASMLHSETSALAFERAYPLKRVNTGETTSEVDAPPADARVGPWRLVSELGRGGMGVVWLAERADGQFEQRAALKLIKRGMDSDAVLKRFLRERQILARLDHPHIAHLLDGGLTADGRPYFAMEYVEGSPLLRYCHEQVATLERRLRLFLDVCEALQYAHANHVVHRDLKPSNVMVTPGGTVKLLDFGIAKLLDSGDGTVETITHRERPMTPAYAAPEQMSGGTITAATDVFALGCVLYELLTGQRARNADRAIDVNQLLHLAETTDPVAPSRLKLVTAPVPLRSLRGDLDTIVLKALKREPARRYASVTALAADIKAHLGGKPIAARRDHMLYRGWKFVRRHRAGIAALLAIAAIGATALMLELRKPSARGSIAPGSSMAIVDFNNLAQNKEHAWLAPALAEMLGTQLAVGGTLHAAPDELVRPARADLPAPLAGGYAAASLATLRKRLGVDYVVSGSYFIAGSGPDANVRIDLALQDARDARAVANSAQTGALADLPALIDKAGADLRAKLGFAAISENKKREVDQAQPPNTDIAHHMGLALDALHRSEPARARDELLEIVATTPGYAPAYLYLSQAWKALGYDAKALANAQQAAAHGEGLPEAQRLSIAREVAVDKSDWAQAVESSRKLLALDPQNPERHFDLFGDLLDADMVDAAQAALDALRKLPASAGDPRVELKAVALADRRGDVRGELQHADLALHLAQDRDAPGLVANAKFDLALAHWASRENAQAEQLIRDAIEVNKRNANPQFEADSRVMMAILQEQTKPQAARDEYQNALNIYQRIGDKRGTATVYTNLVRTLWLMGDRDAVETSLQRLHEINDDVGDVRNDAWTQNALVNLKIDAAADDDALAAAQRALDASSRAGTPVDQIIALRNLADLMRLRGRLDDAQAFCKRARDAAEQAGSPPGLILAGYSCALIALDRGEVAAAISGFEQSGKRAAETDDVEDSAMAAYQLARIDAARGHWSQARDRLRPALEKLHALDAAYRETGAQALLALCYAALDMPAERDVAIGRARELRSRVTFHLDMFATDVALAYLDDAGPARAASQLLALAADAEKQRWLPEAYEARLAMLRTLRAARAAEAGTLQHEIETAARAGGFNWVAERASADPGPSAHVQP